jgi:hypothetical protein
VSAARARPMSRDAALFQAREGADRVFYPKGGGGRFPPDLTSAASN